MFSTGEQFLLMTEVTQRLGEAAKANRHGHRDATMILCSHTATACVPLELTDLRWDQVEFTTATLHVRRVKQGTPSTIPILGDDLRALRRLQREQEFKVAIRVYVGSWHAIHHGLNCTQ